MKHLILENLYNNHSLPSLLFFITFLHRSEPHLQHSPYLGFYTSMLLSDHFFYLIRIPHSLLFLSRRIISQKHTRPANIRLKAGEVNWVKNVDCTLFLDIRRNLYKRHFPHSLTLSLPMCVTSAAWPRIMLISFECIPY